MRVISFLGNVKYVETVYSLDGNTCAAEFSVRAVAEFVGAKEVFILSTQDAWQQNGQPLELAMQAANLPLPKKIDIPAGASPAELWSTFEILTKLVLESVDPVAFDITNGLRMHPFFAAACVQFVQAVKVDSPDIRVLYGEFRKGQAESPIWELTPFVEVLSWSRGLRSFLQTGQASGVVDPARKLARELKKQWAMSGRQGEPTQLERLVKALQEFSDDYTTIRVGSLLNESNSSSKRLLEAIDAVEHEIKEKLPALATVLDDVREILKPLQFRGRLSEPGGQMALVALAKLYASMERFSEALSVMREGWITLGAPHTADCPGMRQFDSGERDEQEKRWNQRLSSRTVSGVRNDIQHAGFNQDPRRKETFQKQIEDLLREWEEEIQTSEPIPADDALDA